MLTILQGFPHGRNRTILSHGWQKRMGARGWTRMHVLRFDSRLLQAHDRMLKDYDTLRPYR